MNSWTWWQVTLAALGLAGAGYAAGVWMTPEKVVVETKIVEVEKKYEEKESKKKKKVVETVITKPDGSSERRTEIVEETEKRKETEETTQRDSETKETTTGRMSLVTVSLLGGAQIDPKLLPLPVATTSFVYGVSLTKPIAGPITAGAWGLSNGTYGISLGLTF